MKTWKSKLGLLLAAVLMANTVLMCGVPTTVYADETESYSEVEDALFDDVESEVTDAGEVEATDGVEALEEADEQISEDQENTEAESEDAEVENPEADGTEIEEIETEETGEQEDGDTSEGLEDEDSETLEDEDTEILDEEDLLEDDEELLEDEELLIEAEELIEDELLEENLDEEVKIVLPTDGLMKLELIQTDIAPSSVDYDCDEIEKLIENDEAGNASTSDNEIGIAEFTVDSKAYENEWDRYSSNFAFNQLSDSKKVAWKAMDKLCLNMYKDSVNATKLGSYYIVGTVSSSAFNSWSDLYDFLTIYKYSNPQYFFLSNRAYYGYDYNSGKYYIEWCMYDSMGKGSSRKAARDKFKSGIAALKKKINYSGSEADVVRSIHDAVCKSVVYDHDSVNTGHVNEEKEYTQSAYSTFVRKKTVCAGYALAFELLCNDAGIDCVAVTSYNHAYNKVSVNDSWYNIDTTWADQESFVWYDYYLKSDSNYSSDYSHVEESFWNGYKPKCRRNATIKGSSIKPTSISVYKPASSNKVATPSISFSKKDGNIYATLKCSTSSSTIYYVINSGTPSSSYTRSSKYNKPFKVAKGATVKAMAVADGKWDSKVASKAAGVSATKTYTIAYNGNKATSGSMAKKKCTYGKSYTLDANAFKRKGYTFKGWNTKADGSGKSYANKASVKNLSSTNGATVKLYAQWKKATYKITYNLNGGTNSSKNPAKYTISTATITLAKPTKKGYTFKGWYSDSKFKTRVTEIKKGSTGNKTLYAKWQKK